MKVPKVKEIAGAVDIEKIFAAACALPYCKINREEFLVKELKTRICRGQLADALANGTVNAAVSINILDNMAESAIRLETSKVTVLAAVAGLPGGIMALAAGPADLAQFYAHVFRVIQKLAYIWRERDSTAGRDAERVDVVPRRNVQRERRLFFSSNSSCVITPLSRRYLYALSSPAVPMGADGAEPPRCATAFSLSCMRMGGTNNGCLETSPEFLKGDKINT